jgi:hypothetical protein
MRSEASAINISVTLSELAERRALLSLLLTNASIVPHHALALGLVDLSLKHGLILPHRFEDHSVECGSDGGRMRSQELIDLARLNKHGPTLMWATMNYKRVDMAPA